MGQPKKLTHAQRVARALDAAVEGHVPELRRLHRGLLHGRVDPRTARWAALETYRELQGRDGTVARMCRELALHVASEAMAATNFGMGTR